MVMVFVDWAPITKKSDIYKGGHIRRYYAWKAISEVADKPLSFRRDDGSISRGTIIQMLGKDSKIWVEYGCGGVAHLIVLFALFIRFNKTLILDVHDLSMQQRDVDEQQPFLKRVRLEIIEYFMLKRANVIILPCPRLLDYFKPRKNQKIIIMIPGVGEDELSVPTIQKKGKNKNKALYFGSMQRKGAIPKIIGLFSDVKGWNLELLGQREGEEFEEGENVKYMGAVSHEKLQDILGDEDVVIIPLPKNEYLDKAMHIKLGYALKSCKPVITTKLKGITDYVSMTDLEDNVIYVEEWNLDTLKDSLQKSQNLNISAEETIEKLRPLAWEPRFRNAIEISLGISETKNFEVEWI